MAINQYKSQPPPVCFIITAIPHFNAYMYTAWNQPPRKYKMEFWRQGHEKVSQLHTAYLRHGFFDHEMSHKPIKGRSHFMRFLFAWFRFNMLKIYTTFWLCAITFALMWFGIGNTSYNFWFKVIWPTRCMAALFLCQRLAESEVTVMPSVTHIDIGDIITQLM